MLDERVLGHRVVIRHRRTGAAPGTPSLTDTVGLLVQITGAVVHIETRHGPVEIAASEIVAAKIVPPSRRDVLTLEKIAALGWQPELSAQLDGWQLRAASGFSRRANSVLPEATLSRGLDEVLPEVHTWYRARDLPVLIQVPVPGRELLDADLAARGWAIEAAAIVLTAPLLPQQAGLQQPQHRVALEPEPAPDWLADYPNLTAAGRAVLTRHHRVRFASLRLPGSEASTGAATDDVLAARGRGVIDDKWLGISAVHVDPAYRRSGFASSLVRALSAWAATEGAEQIYLQVEADNTAALALYARLGFIEHHRYHYRRSPR